MFGHPARIYIHQLCVDTGCSLEDLSERWTIGTDINSLLSAQLDDDDDDDVPDDIR